MINLPDVYKRQAPYYASISKPVKTPEQKKKSRKAGKIVAAIAAVLVCCAIVSGGTLAAFIGLINHGTITLQNTGTEANPAYTITKLIDNSNKETMGAASGSVSELTTQEIAAKILPSIVCIQNYQITNNTQNGIFGCLLYTSCTWQAFPCAVWRTSPRFCGAARSRPLPSAN